MKIKEIIITMFNSKKYNKLHITTAHTGKMAGMYSLSTCCACNKYCMEYAKDKRKVCSKCYANTMMKMYSSLNKNLENNTKILTSEIIEQTLLPIINALYFRFKAFEDLNNEIQVINYFNIALKNPGVNFALWTKNPFIIRKVLNDGYVKPKNLQIILSSHYLNVVADIEPWKDFVDKIFTVYTKEYVAEHNVKINCGAKNCLKCHRCYKASSVVYINELLK